MGELEGRDPAQMRISDADRHRVAEVLRDAAGEGRLDLSELEERLEATWAAKTYGDLVPLTVDLQPVPPPLPSPARAPCPPATRTPRRSPSWATASDAASGRCPRPTRPSR
jgi:hypothetical protein